jgi:hypothetical protein
MNRTLRLTLALAILAAGCDTGQPSAFVLPGPTVPSPLPTVPPYVWDTREELSIWTNNKVTRSATLEGSGANAFIRIDKPEFEWLLRGPDFTPPVTGVRTLSLRYRWVPDPGLPATATRTAFVSAIFQTTVPVPGQVPTSQAEADKQLQPQDDWTDVTLIPIQFASIDVEYCYLHSFGANRGVLEIDRIELVR